MARTRSESSKSPIFYQPRSAGVFDQRPRGEERQRAVSHKAFGESLIVMLSSTQPWTELNIKQREQNDTREVILVRRREIESFGGYSNHQPAEKSIETRCQNHTESSWSRAISLKNKPRFIKVESQEVVGGQAPAHPGLFCPETQEDVLLSVSEYFFKNIELTELEVTLAITRSSPFFLQIRKSWPRKMTWHALIHTADLP